MYKDINAGMIKTGKKVKEVHMTHAKIEQFFCFELDNVRLKNERENEFVKKCVKIGYSKDKPVIQEETILEMFECQNYPKDIQLGPFGIGGTYIY